MWYNFNTVISKMQLSFDDCFFFLQKNNKCNLANKEEFSNVARNCRFVVIKPRVYHFTRVGLLDLRNMFLEIRAQRERHEKESAVADIQNNEKGE